MSNKDEQMHEERALFRAFRRACPRFAGEEIRSWRPAGPDPPDLICFTASGKRVGVEISQWAHQQQFSAAKSRKRIEHKLLEAIGVPQPINKSQNIQLVVFFPKATLPIAPPQCPGFRESLRRLIKHADETWPTKRPPQPYGSERLRCFAPLDKYFECVRFAPGKPLSRGIDWIVPGGPVMWFDDRTMVEPLLELIQKKQVKCRRLKTPCKELHLIIAYDQALPYCSPICTPCHPIDEIAKEAANTFAADPGPFTGAFLFVALEPGTRVYRLL
jgi:hypothetical protein